MFQRESLSDLCRIESPVLRTEQKPLALEKADESSRGWLCSDVWAGPDWGTGRAGRSLGGGGAGRGVVAHCHTPSS